MEPEPALFMVEQCTRSEDEVTWNLHTITPKGRDVRCRLVVKRAGQMTLAKDGAEWEMGALVFVRTGADSDGFAANLAQLGYAKAPPGGGKLPAELHFAREVTDFARVGVDTVDVAIWFKAPFGWKAKLRLSPHEVWFLGPDEATASFVAT